MIKGSRKCEQNVKYTLLFYGYANKRQIHILYKGFLSMYGSTYASKTIHIFCKTITKIKLIILQLIKRRNLLLWWDINLLTHQSSLFRPSDSTSNYYRLHCYFGYCNERFVNILLLMFSTTMKHWGLYDCQRGAVSILCMVPRGEL